MPLLLLLLLLLVPPEVRLDGDGRLLGRIAEELALAAGVRGGAAWEDKRVTASAGRGGPAQALASKTGSQHHRHGPPEPPQEGFPPSRT